MSTKRRILFHINCLEHGGAERVVSNLANGFARSGYDVTVAVEWIGENEYPLDERIHHINVGLTEADEHRGRVSKYLTRIRRLRDCIREVQPDIVIAFAHLAIYRALMAAHHTGVPVLISVRTNPIGHYDGRLDKLMLPWLMPRAAGCVFQTVGQQEYFLPYIREGRSRIILNPVSEKYIDVPAPASRRKTVVQSGRIVDFKFQPMLVDAFIDVHAKHPDWTLEIYGGDSGDGTQEILEQKIRDYDAADYVKLCGDSDSLESDLVDAGIYAFTSEWEGLPNALIEAMALGLPIVSTDCPCGGPATLITDGEDGLLIPIKNPKALSDALCRLIEDPELAERLGERARHIIERVHPDVVERRWAEYIEEIISFNT